MYNLVSKQYTYKEVERRMQLHSWRKRSADEPHTFTSLAILHA